MVCAAVAASGMAACNPYQCTYETRFISTQPGSAATAAGTFTGTIGFRDYSEGEPVPATISWNLVINGKPASLDNVTLRDKRDPATVITTIGVEASGVANSASTPFVTTDERNHVFDTLASGNAVLVADVNGSPVNIPLLVQAREDWHHPNCD